MNCLHGLEKDFCSFCNGSYAIKKEKKRISIIDEDLLNKYDELKEKFKNYKELWTDEEFFIVYANMKDFIGTRTERKRIYETAIELCRTYGAISWAISHLFSKKNYHRGKVVIEFRKTFGLEQGG